MEIILWVVGAVAVMTLGYRIAPFRELSAKKPGFAVFPKYTAPYSGSLDQVISNLEAMGFSSIADKPLMFARGKVYGDFSAKSLKLHVAIDKSERRVMVYAPNLGVFFDTGDVWQITTDAIQTNQIQAFAQASLH